MARFRSELGIAISFLLTFAVIVNAFANKKQFYPSVVYLTKSNSSMAVIYLQAFVFALLLGKLMNKIFFGQLRAIELEHLFERSWYVITETCLAFTVFRDDFSPKFVTMFTLLLFLKCFHWLAEDRVEYMERSPVITMLFHARIVGLMALLLILDMNFVYFAYNHTLSKGASVQLVFGFEYAILFVTVISTFFKYVLHSIDLQSENPWENKGIFMLYGDLILGFFRVVLYLTFMSLMIKIHTFPLFAIRPMYLALRSFKKSFNDVIMSRRAIQNLNIMYPDVSQEQLASYSDTICIICREEMSNANNANDNAGPQQIKKLPCDHIFHKSCLRSWFQRQQTCPTCRTPILRLPQPTPAPAAPNPAPAAQPAAAPNPQAAPNGAPAPPAGAQPNVNVPRSQTFIFQPNQMPQFANVGNNQQQNPLQFQMPSFSPFNAPLPPFAFMPPPLPPLNLTPTLTMEELAEMEGNERHNVEARIHCLRNINTLLTASMVNMQQYMNICAASSHLENLTQTRKNSTKIANDLNHVNTQNPQPATPSSTPTTSGASTSKSAPIQPSVLSQSLHDKIDALSSKIEEASRKSDLLVSEVTSTSTTGAENQVSQEQEGGSSDAPAVAVTNEETDELRKRRLQHFNSSTSPVQQQ